MADRQTLNPHACIAYNDIRRALLAPDYMSISARAQLAERCLIAAAKYPPDHPAQKAENVVLIAFAEYIRATIEEDRSHVEPGQQVANLD